MLKRTIAFLMGLCLLALLVSGCSDNSKTPVNEIPGNSESPVDSSAPKLDPTDASASAGESLPPLTDDESASPDVTSESALPISDDGSLIREDPDEMVRIKIKDGKAELTFDLDRWNARFSIYSYIEKDALSEGPYPIATKQGSIIDACIGCVKGNAPDEWLASSQLTALFLMADGTVEYMFISPSGFLYYEGIAQTYSALHWLRDIVSLSLENEGTELFDNTIYAIDKHGVRYDTNIPIALRTIGLGLWRADISTEYNAELLFRDESRCILMFSLSDESLDTHIGYEGNYEIVMDNSDGSISGMMRFTNLHKSWTMGDAGIFDNLPQEINGAYTMTIDNRETNTFDLKLADGDRLFNLSRVRPLSYSFEQEYWYDTPTSPDIRDFLLGTWESYRSGKLSCKWDVYNDDFNGNLAFYVSFFNEDGGREYGLDVQGHIVSDSWYYDDPDDRGDIEFYFQDTARESEKYMLTCSGEYRNFTIHKGKLMMGLYASNGLSIFRDMDFDDYETIFIFAKETGDMREGKPLKSTGLETTLWEWDREKNIVWLENRGYFTTLSNTVEYTTPYSFAPDADVRNIENMNPGSLVYFTTNSKGEITSFDFMGD